MKSVVALGVLAALLASPGAYADEVRVLAAGAAKHAIEAIAPAFEQATGHTLRASYDTVGAQRDRVLQAAPGAVADMVVLSDAALEALRAKGHLTAMPAVSVGRVVVALAVPAGAALPNLASADALRQTLLAAPSIAYADPARGATAGSHFAKVVEGLGLRDALQARTTVLPFGVEVIQAVAQGRYALGVSQSSEIMQAQGVRFAGALPAPWGLATGYGAALASKSPAGALLLEYLARPVARQAFQSSGFVP
jgi:molybdate transport system substrate-binding protein